MAHPLVSYLNDHLAGARFAVTLLQDLSAQAVDRETATLARELQPEIKNDRVVLEQLVDELGGDTNVLKDGLAWVAQKAGRLKLRLSEPMGIFEAVELLTLGVLGKLALWNGLRGLCPSNSAIAKLDLATLCKRAESQHAALETLRCGLAAKVFDDGRAMRGPSPGERIQDSQP